MRPKKYRTIVLFQIFIPLLLAVVAFIGFKYLPWLGITATTLLGGIVFILLFRPGFLRLQLLFMYVPPMEANLRFRFRSRMELFGHKFLIVDEFLEDKVIRNVVYALAPKTQWDHLKTEDICTSTRGLEGDIIIDYVPPAQRILCRISTEGYTDTDYAL